MQTFRQYIAFFLLLAFVRVMVPDALMLKLHAHQHTEHHAAHGHHITHDHGLELDVKHTHCPVEDVFNAPYQPELFHFSLVPLTHSDSYAELESFPWAFTVPHSLYLRGPPVA